MALVSGKAYPEEVDTYGLAEVVGMPQEPPRQPGKGVAADPQVLVVRVRQPGNGKHGVSLAAQ